MRILPEYNTKNKIELSVKKQQEIELVLKGTIKPNRGQFIWEISTETGDVKRAEYRRDTVGYGLNERIIEKLIIRNGCIYIPAINAKNAQKKYSKCGMQEFYYAKSPMLSLSNITFK